MEAKVGTIGYQAPEVEEGALVDTSVDMWAFGVLMHELAVAYKPTHRPNFALYSTKKPTSSPTLLPLPYNAADWAKRDHLLLDLIYQCL
jgi:serine/threonine protein kinase